MRYKAGRRVAERPAWARVSPSEWPGGPAAWFAEASGWLDANPAAYSLWVEFISTPLPAGAG